MVKKNDMKEKEVKVEKVKKPRKPRATKTKKFTRTAVPLWVNATEGGFKRMHLPNPLTGAFMRDFGVQVVPNESDLAEWLTERGVENFY